MFSLLRRVMRVLLAPVFLISAIAANPAGDPQRLYDEHCAQCHGEDRLGQMGPALLPGNLSRLRPSEAAAVIKNGRIATQMPGFSARLSEQEVEALTELIYSPLAKPARWDLPEIVNSHRLFHDRSELPEKPIYATDDPLNLFVVVELGDHHVTLLDGNTFEPIHRFATHFALHGGPKFTADGRFVYFASRDGWISQFDIYNLVVVAEIRAGINTRNLAVSADGRFVAVANYLPHTLVILNAEDLSVRTILPVTDGRGTSSRVSAVYSAPPRHSFIVALKDLKEVWEIPYNNEALALPVYRTVVHDYQRESGEAPPIDDGPFPIRRIALGDYLDDFFFDPEYQHLIGAARGGGKGQVVNLVVGRPIADIELPGLPHLGSGISWDLGKTRVVATPNLKTGVVSVIDTDNWKTIERIDTLGPGFFLRSHEQTPYAWVDVFFGEHKDALHVIDKRSLQIVKTLRPAPGKTAAHVEFTRDGRHALVSIWDLDGAIVVYDANTLREIRRLPMSKPSGKYNIYNKISRSMGTSH